MSDNEKRLRADQPIIAIVGPTASGKTDLALRVASTHNGIVIAADSRTVYRGLDIGAAKPTAAQQEQAPHFMLDAVSPNEDFNVADFQRMAKDYIARGLEQNKLPILVGGTGLYVDATLYDYELRGHDMGATSELDGLSDDQLRDRLDQSGIELNESDRGNRRRLIRALTSGTAVARRKHSHPENSLIVGINPGLPELERRIQTRTDEWFAGGLIKEARGLFVQYDEAEPLNTTPYREIRTLVNGLAGESETIQLINLHLRQLAKRQLTWFKRNPDIVWVETPAEGEAVIDRWLTTAV